MSNRHRRTVAKEIIDQTLDHFKKQREEATGKQLSTREDEPKPIEKHELSTNFHKVFSQVIGGKSKDGENVELNVNPKPYSLSEKIDHQNEEDEPKQITNLNEKINPHLALQKTTEPELKEKDSKPAQPSVFERLSRPQIVENAHHEQKEDAAQVSSTEKKQEETVNPTAPVSVFQKLSRNIKDS